MSKGAKVIAVAIDMAGITFKVEGVGETRLELTRVSEQNKAYAVLHGFKQRITDNAALAKDATVADKFEAMKTLVDYYNSGAQEWATGRTGSGGRTSIVLRALAAIQGLDIKTMRERVERNAERRGVSPSAYLSAAARMEDVARKILELEAASAPDIDADELMLELME